MFKLNCNAVRKRGGISPMVISVHSGGRCQTISLGAADRAVKDWAEKKTKTTSTNFNTWQMRYVFHFNFNRFLLLVKKSVLTKCVALRVLLTRRSDNGGSELAISILRGNHDRHD